ncbi:MAG: tetratricopeptide repeat protein [Verrucomicrobiota bacterium]|jgi:tetratricopeptide (TPR) repeat protein
MTVESEKTIGAGVKRPIILSWWLVLLAALGLYGLTLNPWVTFGSLPFASQIMGWDWHPGPLPWRPNPQYHPLFLVLTLPLRLLPAGWRVMGLNGFTAVCAALTLAILARSVRLLSQNRTEEQRLRERGEYGLLSMRAAFLPAALAVLLLAAQLTFWENAVSGTGEMIDLLVFSFLILCLLEFRISQSQGRLNLFAFVYGVGVANNWALIGFFPFFLLALIWIKRIGFVNGGFVLRMIGWGVLGLLLYGLIPLLGAAANDGSFAELLRQELAAQHVFLTRMPRHYAVIAAVPALLPLLFAAINWPPPKATGDLSPTAQKTSRAFFRMLHFLFLAVSVLMFFDVKLSLSPRNMGMGIAAGAPAFLSFYYLAALSVGYFSGYILLVFGKETVEPWRRAAGIQRVINGAVTGLLWVAAIGLPTMLFCKNVPVMQDFNSPAVTQFAKELAKSLPPQAAVVLADDPGLLYLAIGASRSLGLPDRYTFIESRALPRGEYLRYLVDRHPFLRKEIVNADRFPEEFTGQQIGELLAHLAQRQPVYYLHPSFGNYFERVCLAPHGLGGYLHPYQTNGLAMPVLTPAGIATNQAYWRALEKETLASLPEWAKTSADARRIADCYSQALDNWGTELQKASTAYRLPLLLKDANDQFAEALRLNPNNVVARVNQQYNAHLRGVPSAGALISSSDVAARFYNHWDIALNAYGPADVPDLDLQIGRYFAERGAFVQAAGLFQRCLDFAPDDPAVELDLAKTYIGLGQVDAALGLVREAQERPSANPLELARVEALAYAAKNDFARADKLLTEEHTKNPKDDRFDAVIAEIYRLMAYSVLHASKGDPNKEKSAEQDAAIWFRKALTALDDQLQLLNALSTDAPEISNVNLCKAEIQMTMKDYEAAIVTLTVMVRQDPAKPVPLLNRAYCEAQINRLDAAKNDYHALEKMMPEPWQAIYYGLVQVAQKQNDKAAEIHYAKLYLKHAAHNTPEFASVTQQLHKLEGH